MGQMQNTTVTKDVTDVWLLSVWTVLACQLTLQQGAVSGRCCFSWTRLGWRSNGRAVGLVPRGAGLRRVGLVVPGALAGTLHAYEVAGRSSRHRSLRWVSTPIKLGADSFVWPGHGRSAPTANSMLGSEKEKQPSGCILHAFSSALASSW